MLLSGLSSVLCHNEWDRWIKAVSTSSVRLWCDVKHRRNLIGANSSNGSQYFIWLVIFSLIRPTSMGQGLDIKRRIPNKRRISIYLDQRNHFALHTRPDLRDPGSRLQAPGSRKESMITVLYEWRPVQEISNIFCVPGLFEKIL